MPAPNKYACEVIPGGDPTNRIVWTDTVGRRAVRSTRKETKRHGIGAKGSVRMQQGGSVRWTLLHQCVVQKNGMLSWRGVEL